jgi:hypothetical protein
MKALLFYTCDVSQFPEDSVVNICLNRNEECHQEFDVNILFEDSKPCDGANDGFEFSAGMIRRRILKNYPFEMRAV